MEEEINPEIREVHFGKNFPNVRAAYNQLMRDEIKAFVSSLADGTRELEFGINLTIHEYLDGVTKIVGATQELKNSTILPIHVDTIAMNPLSFREEASKILQTPIFSDTIWLSHSSLTRLLSNSRISV